MTFLLKGNVIEGLIIGFCILPTLLYNSIILEKFLRPYRDAALLQTGRMYNAHQSRSDSSLEREEFRRCWQIVTRRVTCHWCQRVYRAGVNIDWQRNLPLSFRKLRPTNIVKTTTRSKATRAYEIYWPAKNPKREASYVDSGLIYKKWCCVCNAFPDRVLYQNWEIVIDWLMWAGDALASFLSLKNRR